jgi:hypothetical protein
MYLTLLTVRAVGKAGLRLRRQILPDPNIIPSKRGSSITSRQTAERIFMKWRSISRASDHVRGRGHAPRAGPGSSPGGTLSRPTRADPALRSLDDFVADLREDRGEPAVDLDLTFGGVGPEAEVIGAGGYSASSRPPTPFDLPSPRARVKHLGTGDRCQEIQPE